MVTGGRSKIKGKGLFAVRVFTRGERIMRMTGKRMNDAEVDRLIAKRKLRNDDPFEIGKGKYIVLDPLPLLANHSCRPNAGIHGINELIALRTIKSGEEITYDYSTMVGDSREGESDWHMTCRCGDKKCRKRIGNWRTLPRATLAYYVRHGVLPNFIEKLRANEKVASPRSVR